MIQTISWKSIAICCLLSIVTGASADDTLESAAPALANQLPVRGAAPATAKRLVAVRGKSTGGAKMDRDSEVKRLIEAYQHLCVRYVDTLVRNASREDDSDNPLIRQPDPATIVLMLGQIVADDPQDAAAFDALAFLSKYVGVGRLDEVLSNVPGDSADAPARKVDPLASLLEHHASNPKLAEICDRLPEGPGTERFLSELFEKTASPEVRGRAGFRLVTIALKSENLPLAETVLSSLATDRYMSGIRTNVRGRSVQEWATGRLRELNLLTVGQTLPEVAGEALDGSKQTISQYRGKVVVVDVWTTWCSPCRAMIPHEREMVKRLEGESFVLLSVSCDDEKGKLTEFLADNPMPWSHWWVGMESDFAKSLNITSFPTIFVLDGEGVIRFKNVRGEKLEEAVSSLLNEVKKGT